MSDAPLHTFTSHIDGKNAKVTIFNDRIEWGLARGVSGGKLTAGLLTGGASLLLTGFKNGKSGSEMIPVKSISSVSTKRDGMLNTLISVIASGASIDFRVSHSEASQIRDILNRLILEPAATTPSMPQPATTDIGAQLAQLGQLRDAGVLTTDEFDSKKAELLARF
jgi:hypothetical protein